MQKAAIVQASTCYGHDNSYVADAVAALPATASPACFPSMCWRRMRRNACGLAGKGPHRSCGFSLSAARCPSRRTGSTIRNHIRPGTCAGELGLSICLQMSAKAIPQAVRMAKRFPNVRIILDHGARPVLADGPPYNAAASLFGLARLPERLHQAHPADVCRVPPGQGRSRDIFSTPGLCFGASRLAWGSNYPSSEGKLPQLLTVARRNPLSQFGDGAIRDWIFAKTAQMLYPALAD